MGSCHRRGGECFGNQLRDVDHHTSDGTTLQSRDENDYTLPLQDGSWRNVSDAHPTASANAPTLQVGVRTARFHIGSILRKLSARNRAHAAGFGALFDLLQVEFVASAP